MSADDLLSFLDRNGIDYRRCDHPAVYTVEEAARLVPPLPGAKTKNLFLRDKPGRRHFLVCVPAAKQVDLRGNAVNYPMIRTVGIVPNHGMRRAYELLDGKIR